MLQAKPHEPWTHAPWALATPFRHAAPHVMQLFGSLVVSTHVPLQFAGALDGHADTHEYSPLTAAHRGAPPLHALPQPPQLDKVVPSTQKSLHASMPLAQTSPPSPPPVAGPESPPSLAPLSVVAYAPGLPSESATPASLPRLSGETYPFNPEIAAHAPSAPTSAVPPPNPKNRRTTQSDANEPRKLRNAFPGPAARLFGEKASKGVTRAGGSSGRELTDRILGDLASVTGTRSA